MKKLNFRYFVVLVGICFTVFSCDSKDDECQLPEFNKRDIAVSYQKQEMTIKAKNNVNWWLDYLFIDGEPINMMEENEDVVVIKNGFNTTDVKGKWFYIKKISNKEIQMSVEQNDSGIDRSFSFQAYRGNCTEIIDLKQSAQK